VRAFQQARGLQELGECDETTWSALIEAGWRLGDRRLYLTSPNLRGDDVAELQTHLGRLGFDAGRVDGIYGPQTARALSDFQDNCGIPADGVCGADTVRLIGRVIGQTGSGPGVGTVREAELLRSASPSLVNCRIVIGQFGGLSGLSRPISRELRQLGAAVISLDEPDAVAQARAANASRADVYLGFDARTEAQMVAHYYQVPAFASVGGRALADALCTALGDLDDAQPMVKGMRLPILRETRMPAVLLTIGPTSKVVAMAPLVGKACIRALGLWVTSRQG
jgi:N-acetylmuramoyl-L-alanine amidase